MTQHDSQVRSRTSKLLALFTTVLVALSGLFAVPAVAQAVPTATVTPVVSATASGLSVSVSATGVPGPIYAALIERGTEASVGMGGGYAAFSYMPPVVDGATSFTLDAPIANLNRDKFYEVLIWQAHSGADDSTIYGRSNIEVTPEQWNQLFPPAPAVETSTTFTSVPAAPVAEGTAVSLEALVSPVGATGTVTFSENGTTLGSSAVDAASGAAGASIPGLAVGSHSIVASFVPADPAAFLPSQSAAAAQVVVEAPVPAGPSFSVSPNTDLDRAGATVTVTGSGYDPTKSIYVTPCADIDIADLTFEYINAGCASQAKLVWAHGAVDRNGVPRALQFDADGSFEVSMTVAPRGDEAVTSLFTLRDHNGMTDRSQDAKVVLGFKAPVPAGPSFSVSPNTDLDRAGATVTVTGSGYDPTKSIYVTPCADIDIADLTFEYINAGCASQAKLVWAHGAVDRNGVPRALQFDADGSFEVSMTVAPRGDEAVTSLFTLRDHNGMTDRSQDAKVVLGFKAPVPAGPSFSVSPNTDLDRAGATVTVTGSGYDPTKSIYVTPCADIDIADLTFEYINAGCASQAKLVWAHGAVDRNGVPRALQFDADGSFEVSMTVAPRGDEAVTSLFTLRDHNGMTDRSQDAKVVLGFKAPVPAGPSFSVSPNTDLDRAGATVTVTGSGYDPTKSIYVTPCADIDIADLTFEYINAGCASQAKLVWAHGAVDRNGVPRALQFDADGSFEVSMTVAPRGDEAVTSLFTLRDHNGMTDRSQDAKVVLGFKAPTMTAAITEAGPAGLKATIAGTGVRPGQSEDGLTVAIIEKGKKIVANGDTVAWVFLPKGAVVGGAFDTVLQAAPSVLDRSKQYEAVVLSGADWSKLSERKVGATALTITPENWESIFGPVKPSAQALTSISASGLEIKVSGKQLPVANGGEIYAAVIEAGKEGELTEDGGYTAFALPFPTVTNGSVAFTLLATKDKLDRKKKYEVLLWKQHSAPTAETIYARAAVNVTQAQWDQLDGTVVPPAPKPEQPAPVPPAQGAQQAGSLTWGVSSGFAAYATGPIAKGSVTGNGVGGGAGGYVFPQAGSAWNAASQTGTVQYSGVVTFSGHKGLMTESFSNPVITVNNAVSGTISVSGRSYGLNLAVASKSVGANGEVTWSGVPVAGAISGGGSNGSGSGGGSFGIDPVTFTVGSASGASYGSVSTVSASNTKRTPAAAPPATTGVTVITPAKKLVPGGEIEIEASGFERKERDILVVVYSDPIVLDEAAGADENGTVRWIGTLPEDLEPGTHTITLQGSINAGAVIEVAEKAETVKTEKVKKAATAKVTEQAEPMAAGVLAADEGPVWVWWVAAIALLVVAGATTGLVVVQRRGNAGEK